jgi:hypothetical protein
MKIKERWKFNIVYSMEIIKDGAKSFKLMEEFMYDEKEHNYNGY